MKYLAFYINNYRAIEGELVIDLTKNPLIPLVGINECGKTTILQAICCFDSFNDDEYEGKHFKDLRNLYNIKSNCDPIIKAKIEMNYIDFKEMYQSEITSYNAKKKPVEQLSNKIPITKNEFKHVIISRNLNTKEYKIENINNIPIEINSTLAEEFLFQMPYILYNDDFIDRAPNCIEIPESSMIFTTGWLGIFERLFKATSPEYSLSKITKEQDPRIINGILSDVEETLNATLSKAWKKLALDSDSGTIIRLDLKKNTVNNKQVHTLEIKVVEKIDTKDRYFDVIDRSKGFLWFFNFVMKLEFNPRVLDERENSTIYLLDEPGSYLHNSAQEKLCSKLVSISKKHGTVIYCTHSHMLLNPKHIPLNSIYIVQKTKNKKIIAQPISEVKTRNENTYAFQPIHEALQLPALNTSIKKDKAIVVEGIYDKYVIELLIDTSNYSIIPSTSANAIVKNIQYLIGFGIDYIALWDNDKEGRKEYNNAKEIFGAYESKKFDLLPLQDKDKRRMEEMFTKDDLEMIRIELKQQPPALYDNLIVDLYYSEKSVRKKNHR